MTDSGTRDDTSAFHDQMIGKLALTYKLISNETYLEAMNLQKKELADGTRPTLKEVLIKHGFLSTEEMEILYKAKDIITRKRKEKRFGHIAVSKGIITDENLQLALNTQQNDTREIGEILIDSGLISPDQCSNILEIQKTIVVSIPSLNELRTTKNKQPSPPVQQPEIPDTVRLNISEDDTLAVIVLPPGKEDITIDDIQGIINEHKITFGVIDDDRIRENLSCIDLGLNSFIVARGRRSVKGTEGELKLHFEPRDLRAGQVTEDGTMDFKDRGVVPNVSEGDLLADITKMSPSIPGMDIYGREIEVDEVDDIFVANGSGTILNESGDQIIAEYDGEPCYNTNGTISVLKEYRIRDVNYESGNVEFDGNIVVLGKINADFEVTGRNISAEEILGARIEAVGDVIVENGIIGADIKASGKVQAKFIKDSTISCIGEIISEKEIIDSDITTSGLCYAKGSILASHISAGKGVSAVNIGSNTSKANQIEIGVFNNILEIISENEELKSQLDDEINTLRERKHDQKSMIKVISNVITDIGNDLKKLNAEKESLETFIRKIEKKSGRSVATGQNKMEEIENKISAAKETIDLLTEDKTSCQELIQPIMDDITSTKEEKGKVIRTIEAMREWLKENQSDPSIRVFGTIVEGTALTSENASLTLKDDFSDVTIREVKKSVLAGSPDAASEFTHKLEISRRR